MENTKISIKNLALNQEYVEKVANWVFHEFGKNETGRTLEVVVEKLKSRYLDRVPFSLIAMVNNKCVGICSVFESDLNMPERTPWLAGLYVENEFRCKGVAKLLIDEILAVCKKMGYTKVFLRTETASNYYRTRGWTYIEDTVDEYGEKTSVFIWEL